VKLAIDGGCNAVASTLGVLGSVARRYAHKIPFILKINHNETLTYPLTYDQTLYANVDQAFDMGAAGIGATVYFGSPESRRQIQEISEAFAHAHELGMFTVLWCYVRNSAFKKDGVDYSVAADLTGQANHIGVTIEADIIKQKQPENNNGYNAVKFGHTNPLVYEKLATDNPIEWTRWQGCQLLHGSLGTDQLRRGLRQERPGPGGRDRGHQQACRWNGTHLGPQGVPETDGAGCRAPARDPGRLPLQRSDGCLNRDPERGSVASSEPGRRRRAARPARRDCP
jgi:hypothetical protein